MLPRFQKINPRAYVGESNKHRYVVASQSQPLRSKLRTVAGTPLVHITRSVMVLEPPSDATLQAKETVGHVSRYVKDLLLRPLC